jgi:hypothetical protein
MARDGIEVPPELVRECDWTIASGFEQREALLGLGSGRRR